MTADCGRCYFVDGLETAFLHSWGAAITMNDGIDNGADDHLPVSLVIVDRSIVNRTTADPSSLGLAVTKVGRILRSAPWGTRRDGGSPDLLLLLVSAGAGRVEIDGAGEMALAAGSMLVIPPGVGHAYQFEAGHASEVLVVQIVGPGTDALVTSLRNLGIVPRSQLTSQLAVKLWITSAIDTLGLCRTQDTVLAVSRSIGMLYAAVRSHAHPCRSVSAPWRSRAESS